MILFPRFQIPTATDIVQGRIRTLIIEGQLRPNESLPTERDIGIQSGVSRTTVRQALSRLRVSGLVRQERAGYIVNDLLGMLATRAPKRFGSANIGDALIVWREIASFCIRVAPERCQPDDIARINTAIQHLLEVRETKDVHKANIELWMTVAESAQNILALHSFHLLTNACEIAWQNCMSSSITRMEISTPGESIWIKLEAFAKQLQENNEAKQRSRRFKFALIDAEPTQTDVARELLSKSIAEGRWAVGKNLPAMDVLAKRFKVSPDAMLLAIHQAESLGMVKLESQKKAKVISTESVDPLEQLMEALCENSVLLDSVFEFRSMFEGMTAGLASHSLDDNQFNKLNELLDKMEGYRVGDIKKFSQQDIRFHLEIAIATGNTAIVAMQSAFGELFAHATSQWISTHQDLVGNTAVIQRQHRLIEYSLRSCDEKNAKNAMCEHLDYVRTFMNDHARSTHHLQISRERAIMREK